MKLEAGKGRIRGTYNLLRRRKRPNHLPNLKHQLLQQVRLGSTVKFGLHGHKGEDSLSSDFVVASHDGCFGDTLVEDQSRFDFGSGESVSGDVDDV